MVNSIFKKKSVLCVAVSEGQFLLTQCLIVVPAADIPAETLSFMLFNLHQ